MKRNRKSKNIFVLLPIILGGLIFILSILNSQNNNIIVSAQYSNARF